jgi:replicative DNA helicase
MDDFVHPGHQKIFGALKGLLDQGTEVSIITLRDALTRSGDLDRLGGFGTLAQVLDGQEVGRPMVLVDILQRHRRRRELIRLGAGLVRRAQEVDAIPEAITQDAGAELSRIAMRHDRRGIRHIADLSDDALAALADEMAGLRGDGVWVKDWSRFNGMLKGFHPGELIVLAARPGVGKTALALNWVLGVTEYGKVVGVFSLEMTAEALWKRLAAAHAGVDLRAMAERKDQAAFRRVAASKALLDARGIWIQDRGNITAAEIQGEVDGLIARQPQIGLLVVDHLGLVGSPDNARTARQNDATRIGEITRSLKLLAKDRKIPVLLLCQLNRQVEARSGGRPQISDLRDSGRIEEDADVIMFIHRKSQDETNRDAELIVAKQREGPIGSIGMSWAPELTRFSEIERFTRAVEPESWV